MSAKNVHEIQRAIRRTINGNLDGSIDESQVRHIVAVAAQHAVPEQDILIAFERAVGRTVDGVPIKRIIEQTLHRRPRRDDN